MSIAEKLTTIAENEQRVFEAGQKVESNLFWDGLQEYGEREAYDYMCGWDAFIVDKETSPRWTFKPKHRIYPKTASNMFRGFNCNSGGSIKYADLKIDLSQWFEDLGVTFNLSRCTTVQNLFYMAWGLTRVPVLNLSKATTTANLFGYSSIKTVDGIVSSETTNWVSSTFGSETKITHCPFSGVIAKSLNLSKTNLDYESLMSVLNTLKNLSGTGTTLTLTLNSTLISRLEATEEGRQALTNARDTKGWTIVG